jgi:SAM-dependent methyltransferase
VHAGPRATPEAPLKVLEIGAGIGTMIERLVEWDLLQQAAYTAIDIDPEAVAESRRRLPSWMAEHGFKVRQDGVMRQCFRRREREIVVDTEAVDVLSFVARPEGQRAWDLLIAHAVLDLLDLSTTLPSLLALLRPGGLCYFTLAFDGATILQPEIDAGLDAQIEALYHQTMDRRRSGGRPAGDSRTGRRLFGLLRAMGVDLVDVGSSDWIVFAGPQGYVGDEAYFLHFIIHTIGSALEGHPQLEPGRLAGWLGQRHAQVESGSLVYIAHQLDVLGRVQGTCGSL